MSLVFFHGTVCSGKTSHMLLASYAFKRHALLVKPAVDSRGGTKIWARTLSREADVVLDDDTPLDLNGIQRVFVDEAQFLSPRQIDRLERVSLEVPVHCYGLRIDYRGKLFEGSKLLFEKATEIREIRTACHECFERPATWNLKRVNGYPVFEGSGAIELGAEELYTPICRTCKVALETGQNFK